MAAEDEKAELIRILREDKYLSHSRSVDDRLAKLEEKLIGQNGGTNSDKSGDDRDGKTDPPPKKDTPNDPERKQKKSLWWGDQV